MNDCEYCERQFDTDEEYVAHLHEDHTDDELGRIDRRRVEQVYGTDADGSGDWSGPMVLGAIVLITSGLVGGVIALPGIGGTGGHGGGGGTGGHGGGSGPSSLGAVHYHGTMRMTVDGSAVDFGADRYQMQDGAFHFEGGDGTRWHVHAEGVTLEYALSTLGIEVTESSVRFDGRVYRDDDPNTSVVLTVDGDPVTPGEYVLQRGDRVRIVVGTTTNGN